MEIFNIKAIFIFRRSHLKDDFSSGILWHYGDALGR